ncbi:MULTISPECIES: peptidoglycan endopeptidase [unclassified Anoxybacillus]|uniref:C40 family peptidase n=1 Tax=unclassified Anoxybacillus TaxID=2639704 RepID=UPI001EDC2669|nr:MULTISPECIES: peptidoglycan endopeptidase [unclassified Anoxybacillus]MCG3083695.1 LysM peptidoglycan-binding domain-containing protein [Anoxybacillus sp. LAT27]MCG5025336.1 LysM peptidoglycan-binding domain-containing protein [Anoxybacillus flavithermus]MCG6175263.1 LysM peptidoglycan-binding domain-containing protein [Anoxybacillus sp. LAT_31]MCG6179360.1 LysM peptidoglycan-binding domain-containing protein [Anoxybacillus sp. LAT_33]
MKKTIVAGAVLSTLFLGEKAVDAAQYTVKSGDSLWKIAQTFRTSVNELKTLNRLTSDTIFIGQVLQVPDAQATAATTQPASTTTQTTQPTNATTYTIQSGDTLSTIAKKFNTTVMRLLELNPTITDVNRIYVGQVLKVPTATNTATNTLVSPAPTPTTSQTSAPTQTNSATKRYIVQPGDSLSSIAKTFQTTVNDLLALNPTITNVDFIRVGQTINVPLSWEERANAIIETGKKYMGAKYLFGAPTTRTDVFDCSSFTYRVYSENGITLPRTSREQALVGTEVPLASVRKGDLIFFDTDGDGVINHVSIVADSETLLHAATSTGVAFANMKPYWAPRAVKAVRLF